MPAHRVYVEPFCGGCNVLLNKPAAAVEVAGDACGAVVNFWRVLRRSPGAMRDRLRGVTYDEATFRGALWMLGHPTPDPLDWAAHFLIANRMSRGGLGEAFAWSERLRGGQPGDKNAWETALAGLDAVAERIAGVRFRAGEAIDLIRRHDGPETLTYCDPPYLHATRTVRTAYAHEMTDADHGRLLDVVLACRGRVLLSGYRNPLYDQRLAGWRRIEWDLPNHAGQGPTKARRTECIWLTP